MNLESSILILGYGTSEGVKKEWDTRGRGRKPSPEGVGLASPNVEENLSFDQAMAKLNSPEEQKMLSREKELLQQTFGGGEVHAAVGDWSDGAENSSVMYAGQPDKNKMDTMMATLGKEFNQKAVISFVHDETGSDRVYTMNSQMSMNDIRYTLDKQGIQFRTLIPESDGTTTIQVFDQGAKLTDQVAQAAQAVGSHVERLIGSGSFIGGDTREEAQKEYDKVLQGGRNLRQVRGAGYRHGGSRRARSRIPWRSTKVRR